MYLNPINKSVRGLSGPFDWWYGTDKLKKQSADLDAQLAALNRQARERGEVDEATYQKMVANLALQVQQTEEIPADVTPEWVQRTIYAYDSVIDLIKNVPALDGRIAADVFRALGSGFGKGVSSAAKGAAEGALAAAGGVPAWLWLVAAGALFIYLGGGKVIDYQARKRISRYAR